MDSTEEQSARTIEEINTRVADIQREIIQSLDQLDAAIRELRSPDSLIEITGELRNSLSKLWLFHAAILALLEEQHKT